MIQPAPPPVQVGQVLDHKYRVERHIGEGGMGMVVAARHEMLGETFAIKIMSASADPVQQKRFLREARAAARIDSDHVARVHDVGMLESGTPYMVMELLVGQDLDALVQETGPLEVAAAVEYLLHACDALADAHAKGIVHRDIKPANLFLSKRPDGRPLVKVLDFGISKDAASGANRITKLTRTGSVLGSPQFIAPEQLLSSSDVDHRADIWSLGATLFELLTGESAFDGVTLADLYAAIMRDDPRSMRSLRPEIPAGLDDVVGRCLEKDALDRYATVGELAAALAPFVPESVRSSVPRMTRKLAALAETQISDEESEEAPSTQPLARKGATAETGSAALPPQLLETLLPLVRKIGPAVPARPKISPTLAQTLVSPPEMEAPVALAEKPAAPPPKPKSETSLPPAVVAAPRPPPKRRALWPLALLVAVIVVGALIGLRMWRKRAVERDADSRETPARREHNRERDAPPASAPAPAPVIPSPALPNDPLTQKLVAMADRADENARARRYEEARDLASQTLNLALENGIRAPFAPVGRALAVHGDIEVDALVAQLLSGVTSPEHADAANRAYGLAEVWDPCIALRRACVWARMRDAVRDPACMIGPQRRPGLIAEYSADAKDLFATMLEGREGCVAEIARAEKIIEAGK